MTQTRGEGHVRMQVEQSHVARNTAATRGWMRREGSSGEPLGRAQPCPPLIWCSWRPELRENRLLLF